MAATLIPERAHEDQSDTDLVAAVRDGDDAAFAALYSRYHSAIVRFAHGMMRDWAKAEDVTQEVFISALRRMRETERPITFRPWVYEIARNACIDQFRRAKRAEELPIESDALRPRERAELADRRAVPERAAEVGEQMDHLRGAFGGLSDNHHRILVLREFEGLSYHEIGERMGLTRPSVESTLFRARRRLGEEYADVQTGRRCDDVREALGPVAGGIAGARERRRVQRHLAWCSSCRGAARRAGLEHDVLPEGVGARAAALLPLPMLPSIVFDPAASWFKATAAALGLAAASTGASLAVYAVPDKPIRKPLAPHTAAPAHAAQNASLGHARRATRTHAAQAAAARAHAHARALSGERTARAGAATGARRLVAGQRPGLVPSKTTANRPTIKPAPARPAAVPRVPSTRTPAAPPAGGVNSPSTAQPTGPVRPVAAAVGRALSGLPTRTAANVRTGVMGTTGQVLSTADAAAAQATSAADGS